MSGETQIGVFGETGKQLILQAYRKQGYAPFGQSVSGVRDESGEIVQCSELYVRIEMWTPTVLLVPIDNPALRADLIKQANAFADVIGSYYHTAQSDLIARFDALVREQALTASNPIIRLMDESRV